MKKTIFTLMLLFASALAINAQSLTSNAWFTMIDLAEEEKAAFVINFNDDGTCAIAIGADQVMNEEGMKMTIAMTAKVPGTYTLNGKDLNMNLDNDNATVDIDYEIEGIDASTKKMMDAMIKPELEKQKPEIKKMILGSLPKMNNLKVVTVSKEKLVLADAATDEELTFMPAPEK